MRKEIPQFIDVPAKIIGPLTFEQFLYVAGGGGGAYLVIRYLNIPLIKTLVAIAILGLGILMAFGKYNGRPFPYIVQAAFSYLLRPKKMMYQIRQRVDDPVEKSKEYLEEKLKLEAPKKNTDKTIEDLSKRLEI